MLKDFFNGHSQDWISHPVVIAKALAGPGYVTMWNLRQLEGVVV